MIKEGKELKFTKFFSPKISVSYALDTDLPVSN